jgi:hypothetical protein
VFIAIGMMAAGIWIGCTGKGWSLPKLIVQAVKRQLSTSSLFKACLISFFLGIFYFAFTSDFNPITMLNGLGADRWAAPWARGDFGTSLAFVEHLQYFGYVLPSLTVLIAHKEGWFRVRTILSLCMSTIMIAFLAQGGGRRIIGVIVGAGLLTWLLLQERLKPKVLVGGLIAVLALLAGMEEMLQYRGVGFDTIFEERNATAQTAYVHVDDNFLRLAQIVQFFPDTHPYVNLQPIIYSLVRPIPRVFWANKPSDPGYNLTELAGLSGLSLSTTVVGELYAMHGLLVVGIGGIIFGRLANMWNKIIDEEGGIAKAMIYGLGIMVLVDALRSMQELVVMSYGLLGWLVVQNLFSRVTSKGAVAR